MCFLHRKSTHFNFTYVLFHNQTLDLNGDSFSWLRVLKLKRAKREGGRGTAACSQSINAFLLRANLLKRVLEENVCAYVGSGRSCSSTDLTFSRPVNQQTPRTPRETANEGKKWSEQDEWNSVCCLNDSSLYTLWIFGLNVEFWHEAAKYNVITWQSGSGSIPVSHLVHLQAQFTPGFNVLLGWSDHQENSSRYASRTWSEMVRPTCGSIHPRHVLKEHFNQEGKFSHYLVPCGSNLAFMVY